MCEDEVLLEEEECEVVLLVDGDPLPLVPVQVIVLNQHLKCKKREKCQSCELKQNSLYRIQSWLSITFYKVFLILLSYT